MALGTARTEQNGLARKVIAMLIRNSWYVAAWSSELGNGQLVGRMIVNTPLTLYRTTDGKIAVLDGRCAHRHMPLCHGSVEGDNVICRYHGLQYGPNGACVRIPGQKKVPKSLRVQSYPAVERYGAVWVWPGDEKQANEALIPVCDKLDVSGANGHMFYFNIKSNYLYLNDNLSDLLHQAYLHNPSFGGDTQSLGETIPNVEYDGDKMMVRWDWTGVPAPGQFKNLGHIDDIADGWNHSIFIAPSFYINEVGFARNGTGGKESKLPAGDGKLGLTIYQLITPETERSTHFFKVVHVDWPKEIMGALHDFIRDVNEEDLWACEEQQRMSDLDPDHPMLTIPTDRAVIEMRKVVQDLYDAEIVA
ncbi:MAG: aromatic ring-hydroxylating dioxygenase subunit alpha [Rhodospirillales bacterium]